MRNSSCSELEFRFAPLNTTVVGYMTSIDVECAYANAPVAPGKGLTIQVKK
jgi:hypothetical protein